jgi:hypothetical protein
VDVIIDATVSIAIGHLLGGAAGAAERPVLAQMATDARTGTLGITTVSMPPLTAGRLTINRHAGRSVSANGKLEAFHGLWKSPESSDEIIPTRGCSTPTFHGSAADLAGVAGSLTSILGRHLGALNGCVGYALDVTPTRRGRTFADVRPRSRRTTCPRTKTRARPDTVAVSVS